MKRNKKQILILPKKKYFKKCKLLHNQFWELCAWCVSTHGSRGGQRTIHGTHPTFTLPTSYHTTYLTSYLHNTYNLPTSYHTTHLTPYLNHTYTLPTSYHTKYLTPYIHNTYILPSPYLHHTTYYSPYLKPYIQLPTSYLHHTYSISTP